MTADFPSDLRAALAGRLPEEQKFLLVGVLNEHLPGAAQAVLVGGSLVELYTMGAITSLDVDLVGDRRTVKALLESAGFEEGPLSMWRHPDWDVLVNLVGAGLGPGERVERVEFEGRVVPAVSLEDCLLGRLNGLQHWRDPTDLERAATLARVHRGRIDWDLVEARARRENTLDALETVRALLNP